MKPLMRMLAVAAAVGVLVATIEANAQAPATLTVVAKPLTQHEKLDQLLAGQKRLEQKLDALKPPGGLAPVAPPVAPPGPPVTPPAVIPVTPLPPDACASVPDPCEGKTDPVTRGFLGCAGLWEDAKKKCAGAGKPADPGPPGSGFRLTDFTFDPAQGGRHENLWLTDGQTVTFTFQVPPGMSVVEIKAMSTPRMGMPDPTKQRHEVRGRIIAASGAVVLDPGMAYSINGSHWVANGVAPGAYRFELTPVDFTGGAVVQAWIR
jgi:hypothetical protein